MSGGIDIPKLSDETPGFYMLECWKTIGVLVLAAEADMDPRARAMLLNHADNLADRLGLNVGPKFGLDVWRDSKLRRNKEEAA